MTIDISEYWPFPQIGKTLVNEFDSNLVIEYSFSYPGVRLRQSQNNIWQCDWFYRWDFFRGLLEYEDDYPRPWWVFWSSTKNEVMVDGKEIIWGNKQQIGSIIEGSCQIAFPYIQYGWQRVHFIDVLSSFQTPAGIFNDVLLLEYWQNWNGGSVDGAKMWFAKGLGQIRAEWTVNQQPTGFSMMIQKSTLK